MVEDIFGKLIGYLCWSNIIRDQEKRNPTRVYFFSFRILRGSVVISLWRDLSSYMAFMGACNSTDMFARGKSLIQSPALTLEICQHVVVWVEELSAVALLHPSQALCLSFPISKMLGLLKNYSRKVLYGNQAWTQGRPLPWPWRLFVLHAFSFMWRKRVLCVLENNWLRNTTRVRISVGACTAWPEPGWGTCRGYLCRGKTSSSGDGGNLHRVELQACGCTLLLRTAYLVGGNITACWGTACFAYSQEKQLKWDLVINVLSVL